MRILLDDKIGKDHALNANEACVYAAIFKCSNSKGWYANYEVLASALPFVISAKTVSRAVKKLMNLGLVEERQSVLYARTICPPDSDNLSKNQDNLSSPYNPLNKNITDKKQADMPTDLFEKFFKKFVPEFKNRFTVTWYNFDKRSPAAQQAMWNAIKDEPDGTVDKNPFFFVQDFPEPQPEWKTGGETGEDLVQVRYNGRYKICTRATMELFGLEWDRDW